MAMINDINLGRMNNSAHFLFITDMLAQLQKDTKLAEKLAKFITALATAQKAEDDVLKLSQKSLLTDEIEAADKLRDQLYSGYKKAVSGYRDFPVADIAHAATVLWQHIKDYKIDTQAQLDKETGDLVNFIADLEDENKYSEDVAVVGLTTFVEQLKAANEKVRSLTAERTAERMARTVGAVKTARAASDEAYRNIVAVVNGLALYEGEADYAEFISYANTQVAHYRQQVIGTRKTEDGEETTETADGTGDAGGN